MYAAIVLTALLGYAINAGIRASEQRVVFWAGEERVARP
jgi:ABC-type nitrate/sulfonate/bicarbonate transport system permease component